MGADGAQIDAEVQERVFSETAYPLRGVTEVIIGAAMEVHRELGSGFLEKVYETALVRELARRKFGAKTQVAIPVLYKGDPVGVYYADLVVDDVICEIKAVEALVDSHRAQTLHYLKATGKQVALLINFGSPKLEVKRLVRTR